MQLLVHLSRCYAAPQTQSTRSLLRLGEIIGYMEANYAKPISLPDLATAAHMSERTLARNFRKGLGFSPIDYLIRLRITKACELLRHSDDKIISIAMHVGFSDSNYFWRQFRKVMGQSPREFRRRAGAQVSPRTE
jgi:AraC family L-rhamnose operon transcriptional activator RhaR/AraC family L-rhamnose operon regulatory protein RhaS